MSVAVVTAASGGIGRAVVHTLLAEKVVSRVIAVDVADPPASLPDGAEALRCDLRTEEGLAALAEAVPEEITVLVNVLGGERQPPLEPIEDVAWPPPEVWDDIVDLNLSGVYRVTRLLAGRLLPGGAICQVSSIAATMPWVVSPAYGAAKAALEHWNDSLAVLLADRGIRANLVRPGFVWSRQWQLVDRAEFEEVVRDRVPLRQVTGTTPTDREQTADDVAQAVSFLCSPAAAHLTGQAINVDGGAALVRAAR
ncbi:MULTISPECIES: SDR family NAD(P)-dependent oxidoreductase [Streptomyces]|uniref:Oxidoreductase/dehydrogenase n=1 Tax=Streptomyces albus (strain ATCC 21838 / DSM 41398 / FERM P-419 / JCM 4703 / NBRC 107858) TaxID=1081613 RepID=C6ZEY2_STRA4|nr:SDR family oxidoreductase [Streptomyces sp. SCSIO ZS0520]ACF40865.1 oxidoreductase/dehydrogenase [Streptomyces albus]AJE80964.1 oxidoreductase/dehydrogenase [Streptomyces albus]AOU75276.1 oxidoreductase/dehydrogenase [Streptomyces albus]AYN31081.1 SDR family oxidoreductase [Streptomyces albus]